MVGYGNENIHATKSTRALLKRKNQYHYIQSADKGTSVEK